VRDGNKGGVCEEMELWMERQRTSGQRERALEVFANERGGSSVSRRGAAGASSCLGNK
jgi:hypothetical protein